MQSAASHGIDILHGPSHDVLDPHVQALIFQLIRRNRVKFIWIGMPCTTFSIARRNDGLGPPPLRSDSQPRGLKNLTGMQLRKLVQGNALYDFTVKLIRTCEMCKIPWVLENPSTSRCWLLPELQQLLRAAKYIELDFCQYGEAWRKRTKLLFNGIKLDNLAKTCVGTHGKCSATNKPHVHLKGLSPNGQFWTIIAQPYPHQLTEQLAQELTHQLSASGYGVLD